MDVGDSWQKKKQRALDKPKNRLVCVATAMKTYPTLFKSMEIRTSHVLPEEGEVASGRDDLHQEQAKTMNVLAVPAATLM